MQAVQRLIHENLSKLENINRQYRRLAREGRTDSVGTLKTLMQTANDRWDGLQGQMSANLRTLRHSTNIREDFRKTKDTLLAWLTEVDMQLTNIEHLASMNTRTKIREMQVSIKPFLWIVVLFIYLIHIKICESSTNVRTTLNYLKLNYSSYICVTLMLFKTFYFYF